LYQDKSGEIWIGTADKGLNIHDPLSTGFALIKYDMQNYHKYSIRSVIEDQHHNLWIGTAGNGLYRYSLKSSKATHFSQKKYDPNSLCSNFITSISEDNQGNVWIGTSEGLNKYNPQTELFSEFRNEPEGAEILTHNTILRTYVDSKNRLWIGTGRGINRYNSDSNSFIQVSDLSVTKDKINKNDVWSLVEDSEGNIWAGTSGGLYQLDANVKILKHYSSEPKKPGNLSNNMAYSLFIDSKNNLWVGTFGGGLNKLSKETQKFIYFNQKHGLVNNVIYGIQEDLHNNLWISTNAGLSKFNPLTERFSNYDQHDGLQNYEFNLGVCFKNREGRMYFGGVNGVTSFLPGEIKDNTFIPPIVLTKFLLVNKPIYPIPPDMVSGNFYLNQSINFTKEITLKYTDYFFSFEFAALNYRQPEKNQYAYKLEGFDKDWIFTDYRNRRATYTRVPHGRYTFKVKASNDDGYWNEEGCSIDIVITPPWWDTTIFKIFMTLLIGLILVYINSLWIKRQRKRMKMDVKLAIYCQEHNISKREMEIIKLLMAGRSNKQIEDELYISLNTVKKHIYNIYQKLNVESRHQLITIINKVISN
jgi:DNA-binding CsgD family transcriptional regulator/streptogramin lyase